MNENTDERYQEGLRDGKIAELGSIVKNHHNRLESHSNRIRGLERVSWIILGIFAVIQFAPVAATFLEKLAK